MLAIGVGIVVLFAVIVGYGLGRMSLTPPPADDE